jgi:NADPH:quinone reductase-like Zn-dependent oxidoreductase
MVLGVDGAVKAAGEQAVRFSPGDEVFGQLSAPRAGPNGTYATARSCHRPRRCRELRAACRWSRGTADSRDAAMALGDQLDLGLAKTALIKGAAGGVGSFATHSSLSALGPG